MSLYKKAKAQLFSEHTASPKNLMDVYKAIVKCKNRIARCMLLHDDAQRQTGKNAVFATMSEDETLKLLYCERARADGVLCPYKQSHRHIYPIHTALQTQVADLQLRLANRDLYTKRDTAVQTESDDALPKTNMEECSHTVGIPTGAILPPQDGRWTHVIATGAVVDVPQKSSIAATLSTATWSHNPDKTATFSSGDITMPHIINTTEDLRAEFDTHPSV
jgi:hypothetical protein